MPFRVSLPQANEFSNHEMSAVILVHTMWEYWEHYAPFDISMVFETHCHLCTDNISRPYLAFVTTAQLR